MAAPKGNKNAIGNNGGRPPFYNSVEEFDKKVVEYFDLCDENKEPYTITGLAYHLGFESRQSLYNYEKNIEYYYSIKRAKLLIENDYEKGLRTDKSSTGAIFALKNFGWEDKSTIENNINGEVNIKPKRWIKKD